MYKLAKVYLVNNQFDRSKKLINKAIQLDPSNIEYRIVYSSILYENEDVDTAVGYLRDALKDFPDSAKINNQIAIYYYRSGQIKNFTALKDSIKKKTLKTKSSISF